MCNMAPRVKENELDGLENEKSIHVLPVELTSSVGCYMKREDTMMVIALCLAYSHTVDQWNSTRVY